MFKCVVCHWHVELDDVQIAGSHGGCVCIRCYARLVENEKPMPKHLRRELITCMAEAA
jgi:recombinational DNA repair protein (RecF pathway)